jgi:hypothetical protein
MSTTIPTLPQLKSQSNVRYFIGGSKHGQNTEDSGHLYQVRKGTTQHAPWEVYAYEAETNNYVYVGLVHEPISKVGDYDEKKVE